MNKQNHSLLQFGIVSPKKLLDCKFSSAAAMRYIIPIHNFSICSKRCGIVAVVLCQQAFHVLCVYRIHVGELECDAQQQTAEDFHFQ